MNHADFLQRMLEIPSLSREERPLAEFLVAQMQLRGFERARIDEAGNAVGVRANPVRGRIERRLVLLGHMDVVSGIVPVRREGDLLYGRGSVDAKGPLAGFVLATAEAAIPPGVEVTVIGAVEEEAATSKGARHVAATVPAPDACVIGEPSGWDSVTIGYKGRLLVECAIERELAHTAGPEESAAEAGARLWSGVLALCASRNEGREKLFDKVLPSLRRFNTSGDGLVERAELLVGLRLPPGIDIDALEASLRAIILDARLTFSGREVAHQSGRDTALARAFVGAIRAQGARPSFKLKTGTSDMNVVGPRWGCPIVAYGAGDSSLDHTPRERVSIEEFEKAITVMRAVIEGF